MYGQSMRWVDRLSIITALCLICLLVGPGGFKLISQLDRPDYAGVPLLTYEELEPKLQQLRAELDAPAGESPDEYFETIRRASLLEPMINRFNREHPQGKQLTSKYGFAAGAIFATNDLQFRYHQRFKNTEIAAAAQKYDTPERVNMLMTKQLPIDWGSVWSAFSTSYVLSFFVAIAFFASRVRGQGMSLRFEMLTILFYSTGWPVMVWKYPTYVSPIEQFRRFQRWIAMMATATLSLAPLTMAKAGERKAEGSQASDGGNVRVIEDVPRPRFSVASGVMTQKLTGNGFVVADGPTAFASASADLGNGLTAGYWGSREQAGKGGSDEDDYTLTWVGSRKDFNLLGGLAYYDIRPLGKSEGGDMISPYAKVGRAVGSGLTASLYGEAFFLTHGKGNHGFLLSASLSGSRDFRNTTVDQSVALVYSTGPFRQKEGVQLRSDTTITVPLRDRVKAAATFKVFAPLWGAGDRKPAASLTGGLSYAF